ncbi:hypothetical protein MO867_13180 [Microbulbifer sp. OS29]|uniref:Uncharacterized protein n=1 Tax=Microbulbifer okhotskensis TaxID=2926617 RepID=A0A9X2EN36_9GAMM|nr:hypothetical protein [Microbulbifer okhotskensis]MCO1335284.1 hypothetical protein [Microbulbifer okhotskensis]
MLRLAAMITGSCVLLWILVASATSRAPDGNLSNNPFVYCAAAVNDDNPVKTFAGPAMPPYIIEGIRKAASLDAEAPEGWVVEGPIGAVWMGVFTPVLSGLISPVVRKLTLVGSRRVP